MAESSAPQVPEATPHRFAWGIGFQTVGRLGHAASAFITVLLLTHELSPEGVGLFASYLFLFALLEVAVDGGSSMALLRRASAHPQGLIPSLRQAHRFRGWTGLLTSLLALLYAAIDPQVTWGLPIGLCAFSLFGSLPATAGVVFHLRLEFAWPSICRLLGSALSVAGVLILTASGCQDPLVYVALCLYGKFLAHLGIWFGAKKYLRAYPKTGDTVSEPSFLRESLTLGMGGLIREAYGRLDLLLLRWFAGPAAAGFYTPASRALNLSLLLPSYFLAVAMPPMAAQADRDPEAFHRSRRRFLKRLLAFAIPAALLSMPLVPWFLQTLFGEPYLAAVDALRILAWASVCAYGGSVFITALIARGQAKESLQVSFLALLVNVTLNLCLIPLWGLAGAATARLLCELVVTFGARAKLR